VQAALGSDDFFDRVGGLPGAAFRSTVAVREAGDAFALKAINPLVGGPTRYLEPPAQFRDGEFPGLRQNRKLLSLFHLGLSFPGHIPPP